LFFQEVSESLQKLQLTIHEAYGQTETCGLTAVNSSGTPTFCHHGVALCVLRRIASRRDSFLRPSPPLLRCRCRFIGNSQAGTVGKVLPNTQAKIDADGQILVKGHNVFMGYLSVHFPHHRRSRTRTTAHARPHTPV
jgi:acyl-CoA synthetase (AMP-forming)/AMP-acid ligase II